MQGTAWEGRTSAHSQTGIPEISPTVTSPLVPLWDSKMCKCKITTNEIILLLCAVSQSFRSSILQSVERTGSYPQFSFIFWHLTNVRFFHTFMCGFTLCIGPPSIPQNTRGTKAGVLLLVLRFLLFLTVLCLLCDADIKWAVWCEQAPVKEERSPSLSLAFTISLSRSLALSSSIAVPVSQHDW